MIGVDDSGSQTQSIHAVIRVSNAAPSPAGLKAKVQQLVLNELGPAYALSAVHLLSELGFRDYPATATGKVRKTELREKVKSLSLHSEIPAAHDSASSKVISIWCELLGSSVIDLDGNTPMSQFADSLVSLRFCLQVEKRFGKRITPADLAQQETPHAQARFLERQVYISGGGAKRNDNASLIRQQPFSTDQSWISTEDWNKASLCLSRHGLDWDDVESVYQPGGSMPMLMIRTTRKASVNVRWAWRVKEDSTPGDILECVIWALERHQALRAILAPLKDNTTNPPVLHLAMKPTKKCLDKMIMEADPIRESDAAGLVQSLAMPSAPVGSPALQARVIPVIGSSNPVLFIAANHAVFDAMSFGHFKEDLERRLLGQHAEISDWIPYSVFADMYRVYEGSGVGEKNTAYHVSKLRKQLRNVKPCLWPTMKGPGLMTGHDDHWRHDDMTIARPGERTTLDSGEERGKPAMRIIPLPDLPELQRLHDVVPSTVLKAAVAIVNVEMTGQDRAVFSHTDVGRRWPFMEPWIEQQLPNVMHVAGPTLEVCGLPGQNTSLYTSEANVSSPNKVEFRFHRLQPQPNRRRAHDQSRRGTEARYRTLPLASRQDNRTTWQAWRSAPGDCGEASLQLGLVHATSSEDVATERSQIRVPRESRRPRISGRWCLLELRTNYPEECLCMVHL